MALSKNSLEPKCKTLVLTHNAGSILKEIEPSRQAQRLSIIRSSPVKQPKIGSYDSKKQFCRRFAEGYPIESELYPWPNVDPSTLERLQRIPLWSRVLQAKHSAAQIVSAFAETLSDSMIKEAIALQGQHEQRHYQALKSFVQTYDIAAPILPATPLPNTLEAAFINLGFQKCLDALLGFGFYGLAHETHALPEDLLQRFDQLLNEEARHIVFFMNWFAYSQTKQGRSWNELRGTNAIWQHRGELLKLLMAFGKDDDEDNILFILFGGDRPGQLTAERFLALCLSENKRRMSLPSTAGLQPQLAPTLASFGRSLFQFWPHRKANNAIISPG